MTTVPKIHYFMIEMEDAEIILRTWMRENLFLMSRAKLTQIPTKLTQIPTNVSLTTTTYLLRYATDH